MNRRNFLGLFSILPGAGRVWRAVLNSSRQDQLTRQFLFGEPAGGPGCCEWSELPTIVIEIDLPEIMQHLHAIMSQRLRDGLPLVSDIQPMTSAELETRRAFFRRHLSL